MTIDSTDYAPRPADDYVAVKLLGFSARLAASKHVWMHHDAKLRSLRVKAPHCPQLGCNFNELPHG